jgi:hypothetical protein
MVTPKWLNKRMQLGSGKAAPLMRGVDAEEKYQIIIDTNVSYGRILLKNSKFFGWKKSFSI